MSMAVGCHPIIAVRGECTAGELLGVQLPVWLVSSQGPADGGAAGHWRVALGVPCNAA